MELELHQLDRRYDALRVRQPARERRLLASLAEVGQQMPIVVVTSEARYVVVDGRNRVRCLHRLHRDTVAAVVWAMAASEALIFRQLLQTDATANVFEQAWLLRTLHEEHGLALEVIARRFDRSVSWVSRRLGLVRTLPAPIQQYVHEGAIVAHAAMKYLVPLGQARLVEERLRNPNPSRVADLHDPRLGFHVISRQTGMGICRLRGVEIWCQLQNRGDSAASPAFSSLGCRSSPPE